MHSVSHCVWWHIYYLHVCRRNHHVSNSYPETDSKFITVMWEREHQGRRRRKDLNNKQGCSELPGDCTGVIIIIIILIKYLPNFRACSSLSLIITHISCAPKIYPNEDSVVVGRVKYCHGGPERTNSSSTLLFVTLWT